MNHYLLRVNLQCVLYFVFVGYLSFADLSFGEEFLFQSQSQESLEPSFICIDTPFDIETGELRPPDPSICPKGDGVYDKNARSGFQNQSGNDSGGNSSDSGSSTDDGDTSDWSDDLLGDRTSRHDQLADDMAHQMGRAMLQERIDIHRAVDRSKEEAKESVTNNFIKELKQQFFFSGVEVNQQWLNSIDIKSKEIFQKVKTLMYDKIGDSVLKSLNHQVLDNIIKDVTHSIKSKIVSEVSVFQNQHLTKQKMKELGRLFVKGTNHTNWIEKSSNIISQVESILNTPVYQKMRLDGKEYTLRNQNTLAHVKEIERILYDTAHQLALMHVFKPKQDGLKANIQSLDNNIWYTTQSTENMNLHPIFESRDYELYEENIRNVVKEHLKLKYTKHQLAFLRDKNLTKPEEKLYEFKSPEGEFLDKAKALYTKLYNASPVHAQGINARSIGLVAVETADEEYVAGNKDEAQIAYHVGEIMSDITLGIMPYIGVGKDIYEALTGKHLLTGRTLTNFERSLSVMGIALSGVSGGVLSSGVIKTSLNKSGKVLGKIYQKAIDRGVIFAQRSFNNLVVGSHKILSHLQKVGFKTQSGIQSATRFLKRAFVKENPALKEVTETIQFVEKSGIDDYTQALEVLKANNIKLPAMGKEFLAKQMRFSKMIKGGVFNKDELMDLGNTYAKLYKQIDEIDSIVVKQALYRVLRKSGVTKIGKRFTNTQKDVFRFKSNSKYANGRYSMPGDRAMYTSLSRKTAIIEGVIEIRKGQKITNRQIKEWYHIGSQNIELDKVLDLTDINTLKQLSKNLDNPLIKEDIALKVNKHKDAYKLTHIIGHIAKRKGFKAIKASSAQHKSGINVIILRSFNK